MSLGVEPIFSSVRERGLVPVKLLVDPAEDDNTFWPFDGTVDEFLDVVKAMGSKAVYVVPFTFESDSFEFSSDEEDTGDEDDDGGYDDAEEEVEDAEDGEERVESSSIDLIEVEPRLGAFRARVGEPCCISLVALTGEANLHLDLWAPWYDEFLALREPVVERLRASADERQMAQEAAKEKRREAERESISALLDRLPMQPEFRDLRTKSAMTAYVTKHFPEARRVLSGADFRDKLTDLHNRAHLERSRR